MRRTTWLPMASLVGLSLVRPLGATPPPPSAERSAIPVPATLVEKARAVPDSEMQRIHDEVKTPHKYGVILRPEGENEKVDCPNVFRDGDAWYMVYVAIKDEVGYETRLARSEDLLSWTPLGTVLPFRDSGWDRWQADASIALVDPAWGGSAELQPYDGRYWFSYFGGEKRGYETDPLSIGMAWTRTPDRPAPWTRLEENPVLGPGQPDARPFERATLYKSHVLWDEAESLGYPFVMYYNAKQQGPWVERIGMAVSKDLARWFRYGTEPVIDNGTGISGDPQIVRLDDLWVMFYFGAGWKPKAFDTFAASYDLVHWTKWEGPDLISPSEPWDETYAHKPWMLKHDGTVYHFYCSVGTEGRVIALATSKDLRRTSAPAARGSKASSRPGWMVWPEPNPGRRGPNLRESPPPAAGLRLRQFRHFAVRASSIAPLQLRPKPKS